MNLNERLAEIVRIDREMAELRVDHETNVINMSSRTTYSTQIRELQRQRSAHVTAIQSYSAPGGWN